MEKWTFYHIEYCAIQKRKLIFSIWSLGREKETNLCVIDGSNWYIVYIEFFFQNVALQKRITELENLRAMDREDFKTQLSERDDTIHNLREDIEGLQSELEQLMGVKIALDLEIAAYRKMLEGEEQR